MGQLISTDKRIKLNKPRLETAFELLGDTFKALGEDLVMVASQNVVDLLNQDITSITAPEFYMWKISEEHRLLVEAVIERFNASDAMATTGRYKLIQETSRVWERMALHTTLKNGKIIWSGGRLVVISPDPATFNPE